MNNITSNSVIASVLDEKQINRNKVLFKEYTFTALETDWNLSQEEWELMLRCNRCAKDVYRSSKDAADRWSQKAYEKAQQEGVMPQELRDQDFPALKELKRRRKTKVLYYP